MSEDVKAAAQRKAATEIVAQLRWLYHQSIILPEGEMLTQIRDAIKKLKQRMGDA